MNCPFDDDGVGGGGGLGGGVVWEGGGDEGMLTRRPASNGGVQSTVSIQAGGGKLRPSILEVFRMRSMQIGCVRCTLCTLKYLSLTWEAGFRFPLRNQAHPPNPQGGKTNKT